MTDILQLWKAEKLAARLYRNEVSQIEQAVYVTLLFTVFAIMRTDYFMMLFLEDRKSNFYDSLLGVMEILGEILPILLCYRINARGDGRDFIARYICLQIPVGIRSIVYFLLLALAINLVFSTSLAASDTTALEVGLFAALLIYFIITLYRCFLIASGQKQFT